ncbi:MAG: D-alanine--D-alanine ligase [Polyangiaceae bacterium]|nr:D-alanine--D-alanine ligase [Polyangiaceae bacterium]
MAHRLRVGILFGGRSTEHEVSVLSARNVVAALDPDRFEPVLIGIAKNGRWLRTDVRLLESGKVRALPGDRADEERSLILTDAGTEAELAFGSGGRFPEAVRVDVVFPVLHGPPGEDGTVQGLLELVGLPYVGAGVLGSAVGMDKDVQKRLLRDSGIPIADFFTLRRTQYDKDPKLAAGMAAELGFPLFTKPANAGSSVGVRRVASPDELAPAIEHAFAFDHKVLLERSMPGREIECAVLGNDEPIASVPGEIVVAHQDGFYSYEAKYLDDHGAALCIPAELGPAEQRTVREMAVRTFLALECSGLARIDFFLGQDGRPVVNEINTLPGFTAISMYPKLWEKSGVGKTELVARLIDLALERHRARARLVTDLTKRDP